MPDLLIAVPLSLERLAERGFNQSLEIARTLAVRWKRPVSGTACIRVKHNQAQASLPLHQRRVNMRNAYAVQNSQLIANKRIGVVDDVMTTGHTLSELAHCLNVMVLLMSPILSSLEHPCGEFIIGEYCVSCCIS